ASRNFLTITAAQPEPSAIGEREFVFPIAVEAQLSYTIQVDDGRAMDAAEPGRIKVGFQFVHATAHEVNFRADVQRGIVVGCFDPINVSRREEQDAARAFDREAIQFRGRGSTESDAFFGAIEGAAKTCVAE